MGKRMQRLVLFIRNLLNLHSFIVILERKSFPKQNPVNECKKFKTSRTDFFLRYNTNNKLICCRCPDTNFWMPTRMYKFPKFRKVIKKMNALPNVNVRLSSDSKYGKLLKVKGFSTSTILQSGQIIASSISICNAPDQGGKCLDCRACWNKDIQTVAYPYH